MNASVYDAANRLVSRDGLPYTWDANGNLLSDGVNTYTYNHANRLVSVSGPQSAFSFEYNGRGDRVAQTVNNVTTHYTLDLAGGLTQVLADGTHTYLYGAGRIAQYSATATAYFLGDALGSVRQLVDGNGEVTLAKSYQTFGETLSSAGDGESAFAFTGEAVDSTGLVYLRARYLDPAQGRFISRDTWEGDYGQPLTLNKWLYVSANPINFTDHSGKLRECPPGLIPSRVGCLPHNFSNDLVELYNDCNYDTGGNSLVKAPVRGWPLQPWEVDLLKLVVVSESRSATFPIPVSQMIAWIYLNRITVGGRAGAPLWQGPSRGLEQGLWQAVKGNQSAVSCLYYDCDGDGNGPPEDFKLGNFNDKNGNFTFESLKQWIQYVKTTWSGKAKGSQYLTYAQSVVTPVVSRWQSHGTGSIYDPTRGAIYFVVSSKSFEWNQKMLENVDFGWGLFHFSYKEYGEDVGKVLRFGDDICITQGNCWR